MKMIYTNTPDVPGREIEEILGVITGNVVQSKHVGRDIGAALKTLVGGEIVGYTEMLTRVHGDAHGGPADRDQPLGAGGPEARRGRGGEHPVRDEFDHERVRGDPGLRDGGEIEVTAAFPPDRRNNLIRWVLKYSTFPMFTTSAGSANGA